jgi:hypothetical protein
MPAANTTCNDCGDPIEHPRTHDGTKRLCVECRDECKRDECDNLEDAVFRRGGYCSPACGAKDQASDPGLDHYDATGWV